MVEQTKKQRYLSPTQIAWKRFKQHRLAIVSLWVLILIALCSLLIPILSGHSVSEANSETIFLDPSISNLLGTDEYGYDVFTRLFYGGRISLTIGLSSALTSAIIGTLIGSISGYFGGWVDSLLMRLTDTMLSLPVLPFLIVLSALEKEGGILQIIIIIALFSWMSVARLVRGEVLSLKQREFITACKALGVSSYRTITKHLIPNALTPVIISTTLALGNVIQYEAVLSFLNLGIDPTTPSWGNMLSNAQEYYIKSPALVIYPGLMIAITVICINFIGDGLRDALDPRQIIRAKKKK